MQIEEIVFITKPQETFKFLAANRLIKESHVLALMMEMKIGGWIPPIYITKEGYIVDGQHRYRAFCNLYTTVPSFKGVLRVLVINSDSDPISLAIKLNSGQRRWTSSDYLHAYIVLEHESYNYVDRLIQESNKKLNIRSAIQLLIGFYDTESFQNGTLKITPENFRRAQNKLFYLKDIEKCLGKTGKYIYKRDIILAFHEIYEELPSDWNRFLKNLANFNAPISDTKLAWLDAYRACI